MRKMRVYLAVLCITSEFLCTFGSGSDAGGHAARGTDVSLEMVPRIFVGGTISRCWHVLFT